MLYTEVMILKKLEVFLLSVLVKHSYISSCFSIVCHLVPLDCPLVKTHENRMHCHDQEICPQAGMSPEISVRD